MGLSKNHRYFLKKVILLGEEIPSLLLVATVFEMRVIVVVMIVVIWCLYYWRLAHEAKSQLVIDSLAFRCPNTSL